MAPPFWKFFLFFPFFPPDESNRVGSSESAQALDTYSKTKSRARREQRANSPLFPHPFPPRAPLFPALFSRPFTCSRMRGASLTASTTAPCVRREVKRKRREGKNALSLFGFLELVGVEDLFRRPSLALELEPLCFRDANSARKSTACSCLSREPTAPKGHQRGARHRFSTSTSEPCSRRVVEVGDFVEPRRQRRWRTRPSSPARTGSFVSLRASHLDAHVTRPSQSKPKKPEKQATTSARVAAAAPVARRAVATAAAVVGAFFFSRLRFLDLLSCFRGALELCLHPNSSSTRQGLCFVPVRVLLRRKGDDGGSFRRRMRAISPALSSARFFFL